MQLGIERNHVGKESEAEASRTYSETFRSPQRCFIGDCLDRLALVIFAPSNSAPFGILCFEDRG